MTLAYLKKIKYNNLVDLIDELNLSPKYKQVIPAAVRGDKTGDIAKANGVTRNRIYHMYYQYVMFCRRYTGLVYFDDAPPLPEEEYSEQCQKYRHLKHPEEEEAIKAYSRSKYK